MPAIGVAKPASTTASRRGWRLVPVFLVVVGLVWAGWSWWAARRYRNAMADVNAAMAANRFGLAARNLERLLAWKTDSDEAAYVLGLCEHSRGRNQAAEAAWARVAPGSSFTQRAILARLRLLHDTGRLADAEQLVVEAANDPRNDRTDLLVLLVPLYSEIGRSNEAERLIEARWERLNQTGLAEQLGRGFEARVFMTLAVWQEPDREDLRRELRRLNPSRAAVAQRTRTLAELLANDLNASGP